MLGVTILNLDTKNNISSIHKHTVYKYTIDSNNPTYASIGMTTLHISLYMGVYILVSKYLVKLFQAYVSTLPSEISHMKNESTLKERWLVFWSRTLCSRSCVHIGLDILSVRSWSALLLWSTFWYIQCLRRRSRHVFDFSVIIDFGMRVNTRGVTLVKFLCYSTVT